jgi:two-component system nitrate/nitrite sensor histidine kinase NarX
LHTKENLLQLKIQAAEKRIKIMNRRMDAVFRVNQISVDASEENEVVEIALQLVVELSGVQGATFVPLDDHSHPIASNSFGVKPGPELDAWIEFLASPATQARCDACKDYQAIDTCPLLHKRFSEEICLLCFPLRRGDHKFGVINLYMPKKDRLDPDSQKFLHTMADEVALALDSVRLRRRAIASLKELQSVRGKTDISEILQAVIENVCTSFDSDYVRLLVLDKDGSEMVQKFKSGVISDKLALKVESVIKNTIISGKPILKNDFFDDDNVSIELGSLMAIPLIPHDSIVSGAVVVAKNGSGVFQSRQLALLEIIADQVAYLIENSNRMAEIEHNSMLQERSRLAREIHDGLAQSLGFLKLHIAQMKRKMENGNIEELKRDVELSYKTVAEAYNDAREAIDGLKINTDAISFAGWLEQTVSEFEDSCDIATCIHGVSTELKFLPEIQIQLIRIIQEALSNVRKHSNAEKVEITFHKQNKNISVKICDNGRGFNVEEIGKYSRHGLRGMKERAVLIDADVEIVSLPGEGTTVHVYWKAPMVDINL